jgi:hypothetical protein
MVGMRHYRYIGTATALAGENHLGLAADTVVALVGETALGQVVDGVFKVQVDRHENRWAYGWHESPQEDWEATDETPHEDWEATDEER